MQQTNKFEFNIDTLSTNHKNQYVWLST